MARFSIKAFSLFPYYTKAHAASDDEKRLQGLLWAVKDGEFVSDIGGGNREKAAARFARLIRGFNNLGDFLGPNHQLVPVPSSTVTATPPNPASWPMFDLAQHIHAEGLVSCAVPVLTRIHTIARAHTSTADEKPSIQDHRDSLQVDLTGVQSTRGITLIDDVVSTGTTAMGCALALKAAGFRGSVRLLTVTHTVDGSYRGGVSASARSEIVWFDDKGWPRAWRPPNDVEFC